MRSPRFGIVSYTIDIVDVVLDAVFSPDPYSSPSFSFSSSSPVTSPDLVKISRKDCRPKFTLLLSKPGRSNLLGFVFLINPAQHGAVSIKRFYLINNIAGIRAVNNTFAAPGLVDGKFVRNTNTNNFLITDCLESRWNVYLSKKKLHDLPDSTWVENIHKHLGHSRVYGVTLTVYTYISRP